MKHVSLIFKFASNFEVIHQANQILGLNDLFFLYLWRMDFHIFQTFP